MGVFISLLQLVYLLYFHTLATRRWIFFLSFFCGIPIKGQQLWKFCIIHFLLRPFAHIDFLFHWQSCFPSLHVPSFP